MHMPPAEAHAHEPSSRLCTYLPRSLMTECDHATLLDGRRRLPMPLLAPSEGAETDGALRCVEMRKWISDLGH